VNDGPYIAEAASLIGDPARANILLSLMDGRALTATELSLVAGVSAQTTSSHLAKLSEAGLVKMERQGRHRYFRLASPQVAHAIEALSVLAVNGAPRHRPTGPRDEAVRFARTCYDHLAGRLGVAVTWRLVEMGYLDADDKNFHLTDAGTAAMENLGIDVERLQARRRAVARRCLDWSERRPHLGGALGAALLDRFESDGWIDRVKDSRAVTLTRAGRAGLAEALGLTGV
jgi:DNA-binding transcriptional ArsR family regulator